MRKKEILMKKQESNNMKFKHVQKKVRKKGTAVLLICLMLVSILSGCKSASPKTTGLNNHTTVTAVTTTEAAATIDNGTSATSTVAISEIVTERDPSKRLHYDQKGVWYEIFVRSFADGNGDGIGDFVGLTEKLDYLNDGDASTTTDLGITGIWLMPINPSPSYHGYDVTDYYDVNSQYGGLEAFQTFLDEAHKRGIQVIMDLVVNHSSSEHPWFKEAKSDASSKYRSYYHWISEGAEGFDTSLNVWGHKVWNKVKDDYYYAIFWDQMPDLNYENPEVRNEVKNIAKFWLEKGVDGFRMDAAMHIYGQGESPKGTNQTEKNLGWWEEFDDACRLVNPNYYLVGEVWTDISKRAKYALPFDTTFNFDTAENGIVDMVKNQYDLGSKNDGLNESLTTTYEKLVAIDPTFIDAPFLSNHDQRRAMESYGSDPTDPVSQTSMKLAFIILMTLPGNPFIYYGEEIGMMGDKPDERIREPFIWGNEDPLQTSWESIVENTNTLSVATQAGTESSLLNFYKEIIRLRLGHEALLSGAFTSVVTQSPTIVAFERSAKNEKLIVIHNLSKESQTFELAELSDVPTELVYASVETIYKAETSIELPAQSTVILK